MKSQFIQSPSTFERVIWTTIRYLSLSRHVYASTVKPSIPIIMTSSDVVTRTNGDEATLQTHSGLIPIDLNFHVNRSQFQRTVSMLAVGLTCGCQLTKNWEELKDYHTTYLHIPKLSNTYRDHSGVLRKLMLLQLPDDKNVDSNLLDKLTQLSVDFSTAPLVATSGSKTDKDDSIPVSLDPIPTKEFQSLAASVNAPGLVHLSLGYENFSLEQTLRQLLPHHVQPISGFTVMGHVAHFNLKPDALPYRHVIGQVVVDKIAHVRTVIHKAAVIESDYRTFQLDLMAGEPNYVTEVRENGISFHLDISKVYWNSRLGTEHSRIVNELTEYTSGYRYHANDKQTGSANVQRMIPERVVVYDVFAGVGPFAVAAARRGCRVFANDLNPDAYHWLLHNVRVNKSKRRGLENITCYNLDGREFIRRVLLPHYWSNNEEEDFINDKSDKECIEESVRLHRFVVIMNLPGMAPDFLDAFLNPQFPDEILYPGRSAPSLNKQSDVKSSELDHERDTSKAPRAVVPLDVFCYCFIKHPTENEETLKQRVATAFGVDLWSQLNLSEISKAASVLRLKNWRLRYVRNVAPFKHMYCAEFQLWLPRQFRFQKSECLRDGSPLALKKPKLQCD